MSKKRGKSRRGFRGAGAGRAPRAADQPRAEAALVVFAKAPIAGQVKTRLCPPLTPDEAATLHGTFVLDVLEASRAAQQRSPVRFDRILCGAPSADLAYFKILEARHGVRLDSQEGEELGTRMLRAFTRVFAWGYRRAVMVGTDVPTLPPGRIGEALQALAEHDLVLGPALDGGYYLIGLTQARPELFHEVPWSTPDVLAVTLDRASRLGLRVARLAPCRDIDTLEDLTALIEESGLAPGHGAGGQGQGNGGQAGAPASVSKRTAGVLRTLASRLRARPGGVRA